MELSKQPQTPITLSNEQQEAFQKYTEGKNIFVTGPGGSGKSELIKRIYKHAQLHEKEIHVCAMTGCAAVLLRCKAKTIHSWAGIGLGKASVEFLVKKINQNRFARDTWKKTQVLIIDEVSMMSKKLFEMLNQIGKSVRNNQRPFGGIQVILFGDFYQLPPVGERDDPDTNKFCFESEDWLKIFPRTQQVELVKIFRQSDTRFTDILNKMRVGELDKASVEILQQYMGRDKNNQDFLTEPTKIMPRRERVVSINQEKLAQLTGEEKRFKIKFMYPENKILDEAKKAAYTTELTFMSKNLICDEEIVLKIGAQVMCVTNILSNEGDLEDREFILCNGSQGIVTGFDKGNGFPIVKFNNGVVRVMTPNVWWNEKNPQIGVAQVPLILAWALTIHKTQGATLDVAEIDVGDGIFEYGQTYVAISRVKTLNGLYLASFDAKRVRADKKVVEYYSTLHKP